MKMNLFLPFEIKEENIAWFWFFLTVDLVCLIIIIYGLWVFR